VPTNERTDSFKTDYRNLTVYERDLFKMAVGEFVADLATAETNGGPPNFRPWLRVKSMKHVAGGIHEMTWEIEDGRATFQFGAPIQPGKIHIVWRRIGTHAIFGTP
jgi:hypothetical protein